MGKIAGKSSLSPRGYQSTKNSVANLPHAQIKEALSPAQAVDNSPRVSQNNFNVSKNNSPSPKYNQNSAVNLMNSLNGSQERLEGMKKSGMFLAGY